MKKASELLEESAAPFDAACMMVRDMEAELERLRVLLDEAADCIAGWGAYASEYFQDKHDLAGDVRRFREAASSTKDAE